MSRPYTQNNEQELCFWRKSGYAPCSGPNPGSFDLVGPESERTEHVARPALVVAWAVPCPLNPGPCERFTSAVLYGCFGSTRLNLVWGFLLDLNPKSNRALHKQTAAHLVIKWSLALGRKI